MTSGRNKQMVALISVGALFLISNIGVHVWWSARPMNHPTKTSSDPSYPSFTSVPSVQEVTEFNLFEQDFGKKYRTEEERASKFAVFRDNLAYINSYNANPEKTAVLKVNEFADLHFEEFRGNRLGLDLKLGKNPMFLGLAYQGQHTYSGAELPEEVDWVTQGAVTPVKNQGECGSCWGFSTTGALEGAWKIKTGNLVSLSEQEFVDCDAVDNGCNGGLMDNAFQYAMKHDLCTEDSYAYEAQQEDSCQLAKNNCTVAIKKGSVTGFKDVQPHSEDALKEALSQQPVSIAIEADKQVFQFYHKGVLTSDNCGVSLDHGVLAVGYGTYDNPVNGKKENFWKVKNSWGPGWGDDGFIRISRDEFKDTDGNNVGVCGIMTLPSYPTLAADVDQTSVQQGQSELWI